MQRGAFHADEARGARYVPGEAADLDAEILALEGLACLAQGCAHDRRRGTLATVAAQYLGGEQVEFDAPDAVAGGQDHRPLDDVAQLADVAGPFVALERHHRIGGDLGRRHPPFARVMGEEVEDERRDVLAPLGERGNDDRDHVKAIIEVFAEASGGDLLGQVARGGGDDADVDLDDAGAADAGEALVGEDAQDAGLRRDRHVGDLVEEQRAAMRLFEEAGTDEVAALLDPEQFFLDTLGGHVGGADDDEGGRRALAPAVEQPRRDLLADPGGPDQQHAAAGRGDALQRRADAIDRRGIAGEVVVLADGLAKALDLAAQPLRLGRARDHVEQALGLERLLDEVDRALPDRGHRGVEAAVARDDEHGDGRIAPLDLVEQLQPVEPRALQPHVEQRQRRAPLRDRLQRGVAVGGTAGRIPLVLQHTRDQFADVEFVVDYEDIDGHRFTSGWW